MTGRAQCARVDNVNVSEKHYENFPVASLLCPPRIRPAVTAIYQFARTADDMADEGDATQTQRCALLADYRSDLYAIFSGRGPSQRWPDVFTRLDIARKQFDLPLQPLAALLDAFCQDINSPRYDNRSELLAYCDRSANPVGRLVLHLHGIDDPRSLRESDAICTALQLINFWQDLSVDLQRLRVYVPVADMSKWGLSREELLEQKDTTQSKALIGELCGWAELLMCEGAPLARRVPGRAGWELRLVVQGGLRILQKMRTMNYAVLQQRPRLWRRDYALMFCHAMRMSAAPSSRSV